MGELRPFHEDLIFGPSGNVTVQLFMITPSILIDIISSPHVVPSSFINV